MHILLMQLLNLRGRHVSPVRSNIPIRFRANVHQNGIGTSAAILTAQGQRELRAGDRIVCSR